MTNCRNLRPAWFVGLVIVLLVFICPFVSAQDVGTTYYLTDSQNNVLATMDAAGNLTSTSDYRPFGASTGGQQQSSGPGYTGHVSDADSGLIYMQARYYDPAIGRFLGTDPNGITPGRIFDFARYTYANNSPLVFVDPDGRQNMYALGAQVAESQMLQSGDPNAARHVAEINSGQAQVVMSAAAVVVASPAAGLVVRTAATVVADSLASGSLVTAIVGNAPAVTASGMIVADGIAAANGVPTPMSPEMSAAGAEFQLAGAQAANLRRFESKLPAGNTGTHVDAFGNGALFTATVPGNVAGSSAVYQKAVDGAGTTTSYLKTTFLPNGDVAHIKDKIMPLQ
ncbi:RHS repeat-associated protein [Luteibacter rhizovicinus]|uniref:RHS repeat-associated protein n=1 Tax=Luteibacter rhizovicinus TaxID=242606 RepID=A0A4R3YW91_9GAMM|nr:RHS repeat-associated core domain-containing protein [Luteibacter rhizovicinus]TCV97425.1 RHS repeat-associated protein [Luteibacter rhizovicinus]